jgi:NAD(P)-dependent dehydrogenase (short-subunit alcohol dehydrogenase family)
MEPRRKVGYLMRTLSNAVVVTGASRGIGHAIAEEFDHGGAKVVVNYTHNTEKLSQAPPSISMVECTCPRCRRLLGSHRRS